MRGLSPQERAREILEMIRRDQRVHTSEVARRFGVSLVTARHDLDLLAGQGLLVRARGVAMAPRGAGAEAEFDVRLRKQYAEKRAIAAEAAGLVGDGDVVALDASTSAYYLGLELTGRRELVVLTNGLRVASVFKDAPQVTVILTGGVLRWAAVSTVGELGEALLEQTRIGRGFFGARAVDPERGLLDLNPEEVRLKRAMAAACSEVIGLVDHTKWSASGMMPFAGPDQIRRLITDRATSAERMAAWDEHGVSVVRAPAVGGGDGELRATGRPPGQLA
ncbi:MAG: DeoR/GlpR transcriptional regulator [Candidatus Dormibacteraeota bacterium]|nr:DeoR/GlpR transcriptional regulator [Candidatus Dormibacteraeota bacterium]